MNLSEPKLLYQQYIQYNALECLRAATRRLDLLVEKMGEITWAYRECRDPFRYLDRISTDPQRGHHLPEERFDLRKLYPGHPVFENLDCAVLQTEVSHCCQRVRATEEELARVREAKLQVEQQLLQQVESSLSFLLSRGLTWPLRTLAGLYDEC